MARRLNTTVVHVANLCCEKESRVIREVLNELGGDIDSVAVNVVGRTATVRHRAEVEPDLLVRVLNGRGLGARVSQAGGLAGDGDGDGAEDGAWSGSRLLGLLVGLVAPAVLLCLSISNGDRGRWAPPSLSSYLAGGACVLSSPELLTKGFRSVRHCQLDMNFLMAAAAVASLLLGNLVEAAEVFVLFALAEHITRSALDSVARLLRGLGGRHASPTAVRHPGGERVPLSALCAGDTIAVRTGDECLVDGAVVSGEASVDESSLTGESLPLLKTPGAMMYAGSLCVAGFVHVRASRVPDAAEGAARALALSGAAAGGGSRAQRGAEAFARVFTPAVLLVALSSFLLEALSPARGLSSALHASLSLLLLACPCAVVMASPVLSAVAVAVCRRRGLLLRSAGALDGLARCGSLFLDKTGTLTRGRFAVAASLDAGFAPCLRRLARRRRVDPRLLEGLSALRVAASLEATSSHPLAAAVVNRFTGCAASHVARAAAEAGAALLPVRAGSVGPLAGGRGVRGRVQLLPSAGGGGLEAKVEVGDWSLLENCLDPDLEAFQERAVRGAMQTLYVKLEGSEVLALALRDEPRPEAEAAVAALGAAGVAVSILSGDRRDVVAALARDVGVAPAAAEGQCTPAGKARAVADARRSGAAAVVFVGDGVNDEAAIREADCGIAMGAGGTGVAVAAADAVLSEDDLSVLPWAVGYARRCRRILLANLAAAVAIKAAVAALALAGRLRLAAAALSDAGGLLFVILNSLWALDDGAGPRPAAMAERPAGEAGAAEEGTRLLEGMGKGDRGYGATAAQELKV